ncbi:MAG: bifunctional nuclease family protein [Halobacteriaceae archaeon]
MTREATVRTVGTTAEAPVVVLDVGDAVVPILVTPDQAHTVELGLAGESFERPLTHDLLATVVADFGGAIDRVRIDAVAEGTFMAKLDAEQYVDGERRAHTFDVRASDAVSVAVRVDCPIEVAESVVERAGQPPDEFTLEGRED